VLVGDPSYEIISVAAREEADLVLIGSKGGDVAPTPLIGRIVNRVVRSAPCSVLVVTPRSGARGW
jgi:nucleotide-binding universal stress UspA family protein